MFHFVQMDKHGSVVDDLGLINRRIASNGAIFTLEELADLREIWGPVVGGEIHNLNGFFLHLKSGALAKITPSSIDFGSFKPTPAESCVISQHIQKKWTNRAALANNSVVHRSTRLFARALAHLFAVEIVDLNDRVRPLTKRELAHLPTVCEIVKGAPLRPVSFRGQSGKRVFEVLSRSTFSC